MLFSLIFYSIYKYWIKNDRSINLISWVVLELQRWKNIYEETKLHCKAYLLSLNTGKTCAPDNTKQIIKLLESLISRHQQKPDMLSFNFKKINASSQVSF